MSTPIRESFSLKRYSICGYLALLLLITLFSGTRVWSWSGELDSYAPLTPKAEMMQKRESVVPDLFTGALNLDLPLLSLEAGKLRIPVELSYHSAIQLDTTQSPAWLNHPRAS